MSTLDDRTAAAIAAFRLGDMPGTIVLAEKAIEQAGESAILRHLLGIASCRAGDLDSGIMNLQRAAVLQPRDPQILIMLMRALIDARRPVEALSIGFTADGLPSHVVASLWRTRAEAAHAAGEAELEADALTNVAELEPSDDDARDALVLLLLATDRVAVALEQLDMLPPTRERLRHRSTALIGLRRFEEAMAIVMKLLADEPDDRAAWLSALLIADRQRDTPRLESLTELATAAGYADPELNYARALAAKNDGRMEDALALAQASEVTGEPARAFALAASLADRLGRADEAIAAAVAKSAATPGRAQWLERGAAHRATLDHLLTHMTPQWAAGWCGAPAQDRPAPAFLVGFPRSGTTLLDTFLMGHRAIVVIEEEQMLDLAARELGAQEELDRADAASITRARAAYFAELDRHLPADGGKRLVIDKLPLAMTGIPVIKRLFPDARIILAVRHPADCVVSNFLQAFRLNDAMASFLDLEDAARFYDVAMRVMVRSLDLLEVDHRTIGYEQLVTDPEAELRPLIDWLGLEWDASLLDHRRTAATRGAIVTPSYDQVTQPLHRRAAGRWRKYATFLEPVRPLIEPWAIKHGYGAMRAGGGEPEKAI